MNVEILIKALEFIARKDGGSVPLSADSACLVAKEALQAYEAAQPSAQRTATPPAGVDITCADEASEYMRSGK